MAFRSLRITRHAMQPTPFSPYASVRLSLYMLLLFMNQTRRALISASPSAKVSKRMEIREQDFSFQDGAREQPVIEVVTKDVRTADIFNVMQAIGGDEDAAEHAASWWKDAVTEEFTRQDVVVLALIAICVLRLVVFVFQVLWKLVRLPMQWYTTMEKEMDGDIEEKCSVETVVRLRKQLAIVRFCHLQFLLVIEKLKREMKDAKKEDTQQMVASLAVSQHEESEEVTLAEMLATLQKIQAKDSSFKASEVEEHLVDIKQDVEEEEDIDSGLPEAWERLQEIYASFLRIQATIIRRQKRRTTWQWQLQQHEQHSEDTSRRRQRRLPSSEDPTDEVLQELQELTKELPQGFTADMFTSLGNAMHEKMVAAGPETSPIPSVKTPYTVNTAAIPTAAKYSATAQKAA
ncbi:hypothetical protein, variant 1 [Phytophthora nicotianae INRA-310]|uniref:Uncharacterized protein n=8 Tax=Phytophthora nicotianae TaxID=4792 RepID=W2QVK1_PHYN3|nr:hypothetical protein, variant 1 [Phytophthora nicotianae INRA-310]ETI34512.1 hypothetical protein, variant 1 [Phytophthora nicotianae P1569]ETN17252.1 hypothetical protein, variant 1 [Phytophthora nicotianae INRA-310]